MQIREKGKKVLFIRTEYKPEQKRTVGYTFASQDRGLSTICEEVRPLLTVEEVEQLEKWLVERSEKMTVASLNAGLFVVAYNMQKAVDALAVDSLAKDLSDEKADEIWQKITDLQKALKKAGFAKPKAAPKKIAEKNNKNQEALDI